MTPWQTTQLLPGMTWQALFFWQFWLALFTPYLLFLWIRDLMRSFKRNNRIDFLKRFALTTLLPISGLFFISKIKNIEQQKVDWTKEIAARNNQVLNLFKEDGMFRGVHFQPARRPADTSFLHLVKNNVEWINLTSYAWQESLQSDTIKMPPLNESGWSKKDSANLKTVNFARKFGIRTLLAPQLLLEQDKEATTNDLVFKTDSLWQNWANSYQQFILQQAKIAATAKIEAFCIGIEFSQLTHSHPIFFENLIDSIRYIYKGQLIYAANWDTEFEKLQFWDKLDYISIQAGFSLVEQEEPTLEELKNNWKTHFEKIKAIHQKTNRPVLFTKIGYQSRVDAAYQPFSKKGDFFSGFKKLSLKTQQLCYQAFFETFWQKDWFAGAFFYHWKAKYERAGGEEDADFSMQNKSAEAVLKEWFCKVLEDLPPAK